MISGISSNYTSQIASTLFSKLDSKNQGYFEKTDLESALSATTSLSDTGDTLSIDDVFSQLDGDGDGKVTQDELTSSLQKLADELNSQYDSMRMGGMGGGGMPPPPPPQSGAGGASSDQGFTLEELQSQLAEIGSTDSQRSGLLSEIIGNFEAADSNGDGEVSFAEAMAFDQTNNASTASATADDASDATATSATAAAGSQDSNDMDIMRMVMELMRAYSPESFQPSMGGFSAQA